MSDKITLRFDLRLTVDGFTVEVDADKANELLKRFEENNIQDYEDIDGLLDLSNRWMDLVNASNDIEVADVQVVDPDPREPPDL
jgi:hypothetical protein